MLFLTNDCCSQKITPQVQKNQLSFSDIYTDAYNDETFLKNRRTIKVCRSPMSLHWSKPFHVIIRLLLPDDPDCVCNDALRLL